jgi:hypothetical protein
LRLSFSSRSQLASVWRDNLFGHQGVLLPVKHELPLGQEIDLEVLVRGESWGRARFLPLWCNRYGQDTSQTPRGLFLSLVQAESQLEQRLDQL